MEVGYDITKYESFINNILKEDLKTFEFKLNKINEEITQYYELRSTVKHLLHVNETRTNPNEVAVKSLMDIGCNFMMEAHVTDLSKIIIHIGLEYYLEFPLKEAEKYIESRLEMLIKQAEHLEEQIIRVKARIKMCLLGIGELQKIN